jgi:hypothetical protein
LLASTYDEHLLFVFERPAFLTMTGLIAAGVALLSWRRWRLRRAALPSSDA